MVEQKQIFDDEQVLNGVYERLEEIGYGTFATVYKCRAWSAEPLTNGRFLADAHLAMLQIVARDSPEIEFTQTESYDDYSEEKKNALAELSQLQKVLPQNNTQYAKESDQSKTKIVAVKKSKVNKFNDRDGILFYALREAHILQILKGQKHVC